MTSHNAIGIPITVEVLGPVKPDRQVVMRALMRHGSDIKASTIYRVQWSVEHGQLLLPRGGAPGSEVTDEVFGNELFTGHHVLYCAQNVVPGQEVKLSVRVADQEDNEVSRANFEIEAVSEQPDPAPPPERKPIDATLSRTLLSEQEVQALFFAIRRSTRQLSFPKFAAFLDELLRCPGPSRSVVHGIAARRALPFPGIDPYRLLKAAAEAFLVINCCVNALDDLPPRVKAAEKRYQLDASLTPPQDLEETWERYLSGYVDGHRFSGMLPYLALIRSKLPEINVGHYLKLKGEQVDEGEIEEKMALFTQEIRVKQSVPCFLELIWSYWHEEAMQVQTMAAIGARFQNRRLGSGRDPLANLEIDFLRPLSNLLWGYIQDEQHRLSVVRRAYEYEHQYGLPLHGRAVGTLHVADRRSKFLEAFHNLLYRCTEFFRQDDDKTVVADAFPVLNSLKETHYVLAQGAHNQFGDLPATARQEMLVEQWLLARPEMREFLGGRLSVPYPEEWMDRVDTMKTLQGWNDVSVVHFHDLGVFGEQILLGIRYHTWSLENDPKTAVAWARYWRSQIQGYIHAYRVVTGIDLTADITDTQQLSQRYLPPSAHLRRRLVQQKAT